jgi:hypothetical protein
MAGDARAPDTVAPKAAPAGEPTPAAEPTPAGARTPTDERPALVLRDLR